MELIEFILDSMLIHFLLGVFSVVLLYWYSVRNHDYWKSKSVPYAEPLPFIGSLFDTIKKPWLTAVHMTSTYCQSLSVVAEGGVPYVSRCASTTPIFSIGDRSREQADQESYLIGWVKKNSSRLRARCGRVLPCWDMAEGKC
ncbi:hypothetical protein TNCV_4341311 [Trichonephila clavipes]|nr:hypothetical protein TNCV_4341311 [Trichonephila clavipes]